MNVFITLKQVGKRKPTLKEQNFDLKIIPNATLEELIIALVAHQVVEFNNNIILSKNNLENFNAVNHFLPIIKGEGKLHFNLKYNQQTVEVEHAIKVALQAFEDGLFAFFVNDCEIKQLHAKTSIQENSKISIIKLTFLAGSIW